MGRGTRNMPGPMYSKSGTDRLGYKGQTMYSNDGYYDDDDDQEERYIISGPTPPVKFKSGHPFKDQSAMVVGVTYGGQGGTR